MMRLMSRRPFLGANWKMNPIPDGAFTSESPYRRAKNLDVVVFPSLLDLQALQSADIALGGQWGHENDTGAATGDISMMQLKTHGCSFVLCGHSERREHHHETDVRIRAMLLSALRHGLTPLLCIGETAVEKAEGRTEEILKTQLSTVSDVLKQDPSTVIAYEPRWAIGTGKTPTAMDVQSLHTFIRSLLPHPESTRIVYGGSLSSKNASEFFSQPDIDGGLIGASSLSASEMRSIRSILENVSR